MAMPRKPVCKNAGDVGNDHVRGCGGLAATSAVLRDARDGSGAAERSKLEAEFMKVVFCSGEAYLPAAAYTSPVMIKNRKNPAAYTRPLPREPELALMLLLTHPLSGSKGGVRPLPLLDGCLTVGPTHWLRCLNVGPTYDRPDTAVRTVEVCSVARCGPGD